MSIENKKISDEELDNVSGGCSEDKYFPGNRYSYNGYTIPVDKYCGVIGQKYLFVDNNNTNEWYFGELRNSYEKNNGAYTTRTHDIYLVDGSLGSKFANDNHYISVHEDYGTLELDGDKYKMYAKA